MALSKFIPGSVSNIASRDLKRLNDVQAGLGEIALRFVLKGTDETVLSTLSVACSSNPLEAGGTRFYYGDKSETQRRPKIFLDTQPYDVELLSRYAQVLAASCKTVPELMGSEKTPLALRILFSEALLATVGNLNSYPREVRNAPVKGLTPEVLARVCKVLGGSLEDVFELLFWDAGPYSQYEAKHYRKLCCTKEFVLAHTDAALKGSARCPANGRAEFAAAIADWQLAGTEPFLSTLLAQAGDGAKSVREAALKALRDVPAAAIEARALEQLSGGSVSVRSGMVTLLFGLGSETAFDALKAHAKTEKTARIKAAIDSVLATQAGLPGSEVEDDASGYTAIDGSRVSIPPLRPLETGPVIKLSNEDRTELREKFDAQNRQIDDWNRKHKKTKYFHKQPHLEKKNLEAAQRLLEGETIKVAKKSDVAGILYQIGEDVMIAHLAKQPQKVALSIAFSSMHNISYWLSPYLQAAVSNVIQSYLSAPNADARAIDALWRDLELVITMGGWAARYERPAKKGDVLRYLVEAHSFTELDPADVTAEVIWPLIAENLDILDHAFGIGSGEEVELSPVRAVAWLSAMPKVPKRYFGKLLDMATSERKSGRALARDLLMDAPEVSGRLDALLDDTRQAIRAGAAEWIGTRGDTNAVAALKKRLRKEKSELAKAAILTALQQLGESLDDYVGPAALVREAEAGLKKAKFDKLGWLAFDTLPSANFKSGKRVPVDVIRWWIYLAFKLKQPGGNALFEIYLDQLQSESAEAISQWVLDSWLSYDTELPSEEEANAFAEANADAQYQSWKQYWPEYTREQAYAELRRQVLSDYVNSGAATKGILALASRSPAATAAEKVRAYLRNHGSRTSQAASLLDVLANKRDPVSLQVVIAAATRLKQKGVQAHAESLVQTVADQMQWSRDELGDRVIPTAGLDDDGRLELPCGTDQKTYEATLSEDYALVLKNPEGKVVKALPSGADDTTKSSKKQFSASKKELKQIISLQTGRLYEALCAARNWNTEDWQRDFRQHPVMRRLTERIVWEGLDADGVLVTGFRATPEGEYIDAEDNPIDPGKSASVRIAHGATMRQEDATAWVAHLQDYEVTPLFVQFGRELKQLESKQQEKILIEDRKGWVLESFQLRGIASKLGYERGMAEDGGWFIEYRKEFNGAGLTAVIEFTGNVLPEENRPVALLSLGFEKNSKRMKRMVKLGEVPKVLLSECWNDFHAMAGKASFDPGWEKTSAW